MSAAPLFGAGPRTRYEMWSDLPAAGGSRVDFLPDDTVLACAPPDPVDHSGTLSLTLRPTTRVRAAVRTRRVLRVVHHTPAGAVERTELWRVRTVRREAGAGVLALTVTAAPILDDWTAVGVMTAVTSGGLVVWDFSAVYTPAQALALATTFLAAEGQGYWTVGACARTDPKELAIVKLTPRQLLALVESTWASEAVESHNPAETQHTIDLPERRGGTATLLRVDTAGALERVAVTEDATEQATVVFPLGDGDVTIAAAAWRVDAVNATTGWCDVIDPNGSYGPIQEDGQLVGAYAQKPDGSRTPIVATLRNDGITSKVQLANATGLTAGGPGIGDELEFRADSGGTRLVTLASPSGLAADGRIAVPLPRTDLTDTRNLVRNARGAAYTSPSTPPDGWSVGTGGGTGPTITRVTSGTSGYPVGCPIGDTGVLWKLHFANATNWARAPLSMFVDALSGDDTVSWFVVQYPDADLSYTPSGFVAPYDQNRAPWPHLTLRDGAGTALDTADGDQASGQVWQSLGKTGKALGAGARLQVEIGFSAGSAWSPNPSGPPPYVPIGTFPPGGIDLYIAGAQVTRTAAQRDFTDVPLANTLWQAGNAHLRGHSAPPRTYEATLLDRARVNPTVYGDQPIVSGGDLALVAPELGLDDRVRVISQVPDPTVPGHTDVTLVAAVDPTVDALQAAAAPTRPRRFTEIVRAELAARGSASATTGTGAGGTIVLGSGGGTGGVVSFAQLTAGLHLTGGPYDGTTAVTFGTDATDLATAGALVARDAGGSFHANVVTANLFVGPLNNHVTAGAYLTGGSFDGGAVVTFAVDAASTNTASKVVVRDGSGNFAANVITATTFVGAVTGTASSASAVTHALTAGAHLTGGPFDGSTAVTLGTDATSANTASAIVARDANGDFSARDVNVRNLVASASILGISAAAQIFPPSIMDDPTAVCIKPQVAVSGTMVAGEDRKITNGPFAGTLNIAATGGTGSGGSLLIGCSGFFHASTAFSAVNVLSQFGNLFANPGSGAFVMPHISGGDLWLLNNTAYDIPMNAITINCVT